MIALCVDDEPIMLALLQKAVEASPDIDEVVAFGKADDALAWAETHHFDMAFLDIELHGINGTEVAHRLREKSPYLPIIFCTGYSEYALDAIQLHADGYLLKPIHAEDVQNELDRLAGKTSTKPLLYISDNGMIFKDKNGEAFAFRRGRTYDLVRILLEADGEPLTNYELYDELFGRISGFMEKNSNYFSKLTGDLSATLALHGAGEVLIKTANKYALDMKRIKITG